MIQKILLVITLSFFSFAVANNKALVNTATIKQMDINPKEEFTGSVHFFKSSKVASQNSGAVLKVNFEAGDKVKKGDVLVKIDSLILDSKIKSLKASLESKKIDFLKAKKDFKRYEKLIKQKAISQKTYDDSFFRLNATTKNLLSIEANLEELLIQKDKKTIYAPFDGLVIEKNTQIAQWLNKGDAIATIVDSKNIDFTFDLPSSYINRLDITKSYEISLEKEKFDATLYAFIAKGDKLTRTFPVKFRANINNRFLYDGMEVKIKLPRAQSLSSLVVPRDALIKRFEKQVIFIIDENSKAKMIPVEVIAYEKNLIAIKANGLVKGMDVIVKGNERIAPNSAVSIVNGRN